MKAGLVFLLSAESTITSICSTRIYVGKAPEQATLPHVIITQLGSEENGSIDGLSGRTRFVTFDIDCKSKTSVQAEALANAVRVFLDDYTGTAGAFTIGAVLMNGESDDYEAPTDGSDIGVHVVTLDCEIQYLAA